MPDPEPPKKDEEIQVPKNEDFFESKTFRIISVLLYLGGISGMGMTLAMYYFFVWDSSMPPIPDIKHTHHSG